MKIGKTEINTKLGNITQMEFDAIVNAANSSLLGGGGVDGAIHRAAGPELEFDCRMLGGCKVGQAKTTKGFRLPSKYIVHTVGPVWRGGENGEPEQLSNCYRNSLEEAEKVQAKTIGIPAISTGIYKYPVDLAAKNAVLTIVEVVQDKPNSFDQITLVCFDDKTLNAFEGALEDAR